FSASTDSTSFIRSFGMSVLLSRWRPGRLSAGSKDTLDRGWTALVPVPWLLRQLGRRPENHDESRRGEDPDDHPRGIELPAAHAELRSAGMGVVVVVQALAAREPREEAPVVGGVVEVL